ncbi:LuxR C-terminal-related transcriptional regulator [Streptomyces fradiae]|uniref:helix-turn-helix transcriptional regulator n=1 Tax=Streptomyces fradiae TaxID=1906 RepID=UPI0035BE68D9
MSPRNRQRPPEGPSAALPPGTRGPSRNAPADARTDISFDAPSDATAVVPADGPVGASAEVPTEAPADSEADEPADEPADARPDEPADEPAGERARGRAAYEALVQRMARTGEARGAEAGGGGAPPRGERGAGPAPGGTGAPPGSTAAAPGGGAARPGDGLPRDVRRWLAERRLLDEAHGQVRSPQRALHDLVAEHRSRIDRYREELHRGLDAVDDVLRLLPGMAPTRWETVEAEFFEDRSRLRDRLEDLDALCREQMLCMRTAFPGRDVLEAGLTSDVRLLERGVDLRVLVAARALRGTGVARYLSVLMDHGARVRVASTVPLHLNVFDRAVTVMAVGAADGRHETSGDVILHSTRLADSFVRVFEHHWATGHPAASTVRRPGTGGVPEDYSPREREVLALLAAGAKDEAIARRLGCSERTLRRLLTGLVAKLGADSRFAAGVQAVRLGLID